MFFVVLAHYGNIFSLANIIKISPDEAHLDRISCLATLVSNVLEAKASHTDTCTHIHTGAQLHHCSMVDAWSRLSWGNRMSVMVRRVVKAISAEQDISLSTEQMTDVICTQITLQKAQRIAIMPYIFPNPCIFVYYKLLGEQYILLISVRGKPLFLHLFFWHFILS